MEIVVTITNFFRAYVGPEGVNHPNRPHNMSKTVRQTACLQARSELDCTSGKRHIMKKLLVAFGFVGCLALPTIAAAMPVARSVGSVDASVVQVRDRMSGHGGMRHGGMRMRGMGHGGMSGMRHGGGRMMHGRGGMGMRHGGGMRGMSHRNM